jgi:hypothetical protein
VRRAVAGILVAAGLALAVSACNNSTVTVPTTPTPTPTIITENFGGDLVLGTTNVHMFTANKGVATATVTSLSPLSTAHIGMSLGVWDGTSCSVVATDDAMSVGKVPPLTGTATIDNVNLCLRVYDIGNIPPDATYSYTATVAHY